ncbi:MAG: RNA methyltransferase [Nannocystaceae bacterium]|nr:RNA methyltransferase [Nannocystaceae bacterium]
MDDRTFARLTEAYTATQIAEALTPYLTEVRREKIERLLDKRLPQIQIAIEAPSDPHNAAAVVRTAEALGVVDVHLIASERRALEAKNTTQGAFRWVRTHHHEDLSSFLGQGALQGGAMFGGWMDAERTVEELPVDRPICVMFGNETRGLSSEARAACDGGFRIPMVGMTESLNLSVCAAITLYDLTSRLRAAGAVGLDTRQRDQLRARHYMDSVDERLWSSLLSVRGESS